MYQQHSIHTTVNVSYFPQLGETLPKMEVRHFLRETGGWFTLEIGTLSVIMQSEQFEQLREMMNARESWRTVRD